MWRCFDGNIYINIYQKYAVTDVDILWLAERTGLCCCCYERFFILLYFYFVPTKNLSPPPPRAYTPTTTAAHSHTPEKHIWAHDTSIYAHTHTERERRTCVHVVVLRCIARKHTNNNLYTRASSYCSSLLLARSSKQPPQPPPSDPTHPANQPIHSPTDWLTVDCDDDDDDDGDRPTDKPIDRQTAGRSDTTSGGMHVCMYLVICMFTCSISAGG